MDRQAQRACGLQPRDAEHRECFPGAWHVPCVGGSRTLAGFRRMAGQEWISNPVGPLPALGNLRATMSDMVGQILLVWDAVHGASSYIVECKEHDTPQSWQMVKILKQARYISTDHTPGKIYAFRVRALGPQGEGPGATKPSRCRRESGGRPGTDDATPTGQGTRALAGLCLGRAPLRRRRGFATGQAKGLSKVAKARIKPDLLQT